ncbi:hypothetical protein ACFY0P_22115 [Streptomyces sp. NPDC001714]|uniref:hypothetical protein n=1 Tax=Streptomyces sp. NPDC001714 TaxID=3364603 RepID=UPI00367873E1
MAANPEYKLNDVSCSGATIADVRNNQLSALSSSTVPGDRPRRRQVHLMNGFADALAEGTKAASIKEPVCFVDMRGQFTGHGACGSDSWFNDLTNASALFHPNLAGYTNGYAAKFKATWGKSAA